MRRFLPTDEISPLDMPLAPGLRALGLHAPKLLVRGPTMTVGGGPRIRKKPGFPPSNISYVTSTSAGGATATAPTGEQANDLVGVLAFRKGTTSAFLTPPTLASGFTSLITDYHDNGSNYISLRVGWKIAAGSSETGGTWTNADITILFVYRGINTSSPFGTAASSKGIGTTVTYPSRTVAGNSWGIFFGASGSGGTLIGTPNGATSRNSGGATGMGSCRVSDLGPIDSTTLAERTSTAVNDAWIGVTVELKSS